MSRLLKNGLRRFWVFLGMDIWLTTLLIMSMSAPIHAYEKKVSNELDLSEPFPEELEKKYYNHKIDHLTVRGLKRIEVDAVTSKMESLKDHLLTAESIQHDLHSLFETGFFDDLAFLVHQKQSETDPTELIVQLKERPVIAKLEFQGNLSLSTSDLKEVIKVKEWSLLDLNKVKNDVELLKKHYAEKGFFLAQVSYEITHKSEDEVEVVFKIEDFKKVQIKKIIFLNNQMFSDEVLKGALAETKEGDFLSFLSDSGNFKESSFKVDLQRLTLFYLENGYMKFRFENPVVTVSEDKKSIFISIFVEEGERYKIRNTSFSGDLLFSKEELSKNLEMTKDTYFSISARNNDIRELTEKYQDLGYAFVNVNPKISFLDDEKKVDLEYEFEKGNLVYFREINVVGNDKTYDHVIRRELKVREGELFNGSRLRISKEDVERLGFFTPGELAFNLIPVKGRTDQVDLEIVIKERSTGTFSLGFGYGSFQGVFFMASISELNLFGRGQNISLAAQYASSSIQQSFNLGFTEPRFIDSEFSTGFDLYWVKVPIPYRYQVQRVGFDLKLGHPIFAYTSAMVSYKLEKNIPLRVYGALSASGNMSNAQSGINDPYGRNDPTVVDLIDPKYPAADHGYLSSVSLNVVRDKRDNRFETSKGNYQSFSVDLAGLGGDMKFIKWVVNNRFYQPIVGQLVFKNSTQIGHIGSLIPNRMLPPAQKFYLGGPNDMKGFNMFMLGPLLRTTKKNSEGEDVPNQPQPLGGDFEAYSLFELEQLIIREGRIKLVTFFDIGNTVDLGVQKFTLRADVGAGIRWFSPFGPLRFEWGFPIKPQPFEDKMVFQLFMGPPF